ncbi:SipW-dependent-type signal peptide-containing protein [Halobacterium litoreum]|uniref:SipW-dependent-type signal peptide-containing protein n=1 Tax=Halobacterium litoreum TaxID=2039234 RepID=A0ABD5NDA6_9EURY|nr:SipW-dependent-type signal peptide-containing protein [Halobacterium litoreum]UHH14057.1 SipW-dependent-type signal peptide-containing protein [Halobacterium litoreum]
MTEKLELTRRKLLAGIAGVGAASAGAGLGTSAYLNDTESFTDNSITAGALNLAVSVDVRAKSPDLPDPEVASETGTDDTADGNVVTITVSDLKPGDWFLLEWDAEVYGNPGYVQVTSVDEDYANAEGANPEPETDTAAPGDLGRTLLTSIWADFQTLGSTDVRQYLVDLDPTTDVSSTGLSAYETPDLDGVTPSGAHYTTLDEAHAVYQTGVLMRDAGGAPLVVGNNGDSGTFYQLFELPPGVGNDVQGDSVTFSLRFDAEQVRNNDAPFGGA